MGLAMQYSALYNIWESILTMLYESGCEHFSRMHLHFYFITNQPKWPELC